MKRNTMIAGSYPEIITSGGDPRVNKEEINNIFLRKYITLLGEILKVKGSLGNIKTLYIGGYSDEKNISRSKLYLSAFNYYLNDLGYESLSKNNLTVLDYQQLEQNIDKIDQTDLLFLGIGSDQVFLKQINELEQEGIMLNQLVDKNKIAVTSICSGSAMSGNRIYSGMYDKFYYNAEVFDKQVEVDSLKFIPITMEPDFFPNDASTEKTEEFIEKYLKPDSFRICFSACRQNSMFLIGKEKLYSYGEIYLFIDGESIKLEGEFEKADVTELISVIEKYNDIKNGEMVIDKNLSSEIKQIIANLNRVPITEKLDSDEKGFIDEYSKEELERRRLKEAVDSIWKSDMKMKLNYLFSDENLNNFDNDVEFQERFKKFDSSILESYNIDSNTEYSKELYLKMNAVGIVRKGAASYSGSYFNFKESLYDVLEDYAIENGKLAYTVLDACGSLFTNQQLKKLLTVIKIEGIKRPQAIINSTQDQLKVFGKDIRYERG